MTLLEKRAIALANDSKRLKQRLAEARNLFVARKEFGKGIFDFRKKRLVGNNGHVLQWRIRMHPDRPESYQNQQTSQGCVVYYPPSY